MTQATSKNVQNAVKSEPTAADLAQQVELLKADIAKLTETMTTMGKQRVNSARSDVEYQAELLKEKGKDAYAQASLEIERLGGEAERTVRERPLTSLAVAAGVGLLFGLLTSRK